MSLSALLLSSLSQSKHPSHSSASSFSHSAFTVQDLAEVSADTLTLEYETVSFDTQDLAQDVAQGLLQAVAHYSAQANAPGSDNCSMVVTKGA